jgi:hypothetical protein
VAEAEQFATNDLARARGVRNGLMVALLALCPIRLKNFAALEIGHTFKEVDGSWWIALPGNLTKSRRPDERRVPALLNRSIQLYLTQSRRLLLGSSPPTNALWISSTTRRQMTAKNSAPRRPLPRQRTLGTFLISPAPCSITSIHV